MRHVQNHKQINHAYIFLVIGQIFNLLLLTLVKYDVYNTFSYASILIRTDHRQGYKIEFIVYLLAFLVGFCGNGVPTNLRI